MRFGFVDEHRDVWPVRMMCRVLEVSVSGYYAWRSRPESARSQANRALLEDIRLAHAESGGAYGAPRVHAVLRGHGRRVGRHRVARLMRCAGLRGLAALPRRVRTTDSRHGHPIAPNRLGRNFEAARPNQVWLGDLTYVGSLQESDLSVRQVRTGGELSLPVPHPIPSAPRRVRSCRS